MRDMCHCGHDKATHYFDVGPKGREKGDCLAKGCDFKGYTHEDSPPRRSGSYPPPRKDIAKAQ